MKTRRRFDFKKNFSSIFGVLLIAISIIAFTVEAFAIGHESTSGNTDDGRGGRACTSGNCYSPRKNGAFWVEIPLNGATKTFHQVFGAEGHSTYDTNNTVFSNCPTTAYVLVSRLANGGLAGPIDINRVSTGSGNPGEGGHATNIKDGDGGWLPSGAVARTNSQAESTFTENKSFFNNQFGQYYYGTNMGWFCADPEGTITTTTSTPPPTWYEGCRETSTMGARAISEREWGDTRTRIAVRNSTLDSVWDYKFDWGVMSSISYMRRWLPTDTGWTDGGGLAYTIAKPGDSVQFLHAFCAGARFVRRTETQGVEWVDKQSHDVLFDIPTNHFKIGSDIGQGYLFGDGISWMNSTAASVSAYGPPEDQYPFPGEAPIENGTYISSDRFGLGTLSPTSNNNSYNCSSVPFYPAYVANASFQIPGFDSGFSCNAASGGRHSNNVGLTIDQWHEFNSVKAWEQWSHDESGSCGCDTNDAEFGGNYFATEFGKDGNTWDKREDYDCKDSASCTKCCDCISWDEEHNCTEYEHDEWDYTDETPNHSHLSKSKDYGTERKTALVYVPFNFNTSVSSSLDAGATIFQGAAISSDFSWNILPRMNELLANFGFATVTPSWTRIQFVEFIQSPGGGNTFGNQTSSTDAYGYYGNGAVDIKVISELSGNQNPAGLYAGDSNSAGFTRAVPDNDEYVGFKYCVAMAIYPSDSHNYEGNYIENQIGYGWSGAMDAGELWNVSNASCRTIAKKPSVQIWNGSLYTEGAVTTSVSKKMSNIPLGNDYSGGSTNLFGSWTDYSISAMKDVRGMASGAVLGYENGTPKADPTLANGGRYAYRNTRYDLAGGGRRTSEMNMKRMSPLTVANSEDVSGNGKVNASASIDINLNRLKARYSEKAKSYASKDGGPQLSIRTSETGMQYAYYNNGSGNNDAVKLSDFTKVIKGYGSGTPGQTTHKNGDGGLYKTLLTDADVNAKADNTLVIYVTGKLIIDGNICLGSCYSTGMVLRDYAHDTGTNSAIKLPQVIIFAKDIEIEQNVTRIDAWLIADKGNINTCRGFSIGSSGNLEAHDAYNRYGVNQGNCFKTLIVNGPVYAKSLTLNRTAGATHGVGGTNHVDVLDRQFGAVGWGNDGNLGAQIPAEIFNLRADAYLWAYNQAQRYSEAVVTYMRELAPRY